MHTNKHEWFSPTSTQRRGRDAKAQHAIGTEFLAAKRHKSRKENRKDFDRGLRMKADGNQVHHDPFKQRVHELLPALLRSLRWLLLKAFVTEDWVMTSPSGCPCFSPSPGSVRSDGS